MKIALLTIWHVGNYGAELQAYATIKMLTSMGHDVTIIDIRENEKPGMSVKAKMAQVISHITPAYRSFNSFWEQFFPNKTRHYKSVEDLMSDPPEADVYMVGSDQVWNPDITQEKKLLYFLNFGAEDSKRISYASSFGTSVWSEEAVTTDNINQLLKRFSAIGCREQSGVNILKSRFGIDANRVLDPTLLFEAYPELTGEIKQVKSLAYYPLTNYPELDRYCESLAQRIGLELRNANETKHLTNTIAWTRPSVQDWIRRIAEAEFVVTPSFHGLAFSLIYKRQFMVINHGSNPQRTARITDLLDELGLSDRFCQSFEEANAKKLWDKKIDYTAVSEKLAKLRNESIDFLNKALI